MTTLDDTEHRLLEAAGQVFAERGFKGSTVRAICERAGVNIAAVSFYFRSKERLYIEAVKHAHSQGLEKILVSDLPPDAPPADKLRSFIHRFVARLMDVSRPAWHTALIMRELAQPTAACAELVHHNIQPVVKVLADILDELLPSDMPRWRQFMFGFSIISQCVNYCQNRPILMALVGEEEYRHFDAATVADHVSDFCLAALGLREPLFKHGKNARLHEVRS
jgi:AcrR family transcriptional regulator